MCFFVRIARFFSFWLLLGQLLLFGSLWNPHLMQMDSLWGISASLYHLVWLSYFLGFMPAIFGYCRNWDGDWNFCFEICSLSWIKIEIYWQQMAQFTKICHQTWETSNRGDWWKQAHLLELMVSSPSVSLFEKSSIFYFRRYKIRISCFVE